MKKIYLIMICLALFSVGLFAQVPYLELKGDNSSYIGDFGDILDMGLNDWSYQVWFKTTQNQSGLIGKTYSGSLAGRWGIHITASTSSRLRAIVQFGSSGSYNYDASGGPWNDGYWHHATVTIDRNADLIIYIDGVENARYDVSGHKNVSMNTDKYFFLGAYGTSDNTSPMSQLNGGIADAAVWNRVLTPAEVQANYNSRVNPSDAGLLAYWPIDDGSGTTVRDATGNYDGTIMDATGNHYEWFAQDGPETLPVELSNFFVTITSQNFVRLTWVTHSETGALGYMIYRSENDILKDAVMVSPLIEATNTSAQQTYVFEDKDVNEGTWYYWLQSLDLDGSFKYHGPIIAQIGDDGSNYSPEIPMISGIAKVYPNPFNPSSTITFELAEKADVNFEIYNTRGQKVQSFKLGDKDAGRHDLIWDGSQLTSGVYIINMHAGNQVYQSKAVLSK